MLLGVDMAPRRIWGDRPTCPHCGAGTDSAHVLRCQHYAEARQWLWDVAHSLGLDQVGVRSQDDLWAQLLGGVPPAGVSGARARVWERLRMTFLSALYRHWVHTHMVLRRGGVAGTDGRRVVFAVVCAVRAAMAADYRRSLESASYVMRSGVEHV